MKKILIASTALVAAGFITTGTASASDKIKLELGGYSKWWVVGQWNKNKYQSAKGVDYNSVDVKGDNEVWFAGETTLDNGMKVGVNVELEAGGDKGSSNSSATSDTIDQSFVYVAGGFGKIIAGTAANGTVLLHVMAPDAASNWGSENIAYNAIDVSKSNARKTTEIDTDDNAEKITYVAPTFYGLTVGATYIPNAMREDNRGLTTLSNTSAATLGSEAYGAGALYAKEFGPVGLKVSSGWVHYDLSGPVGIAKSSNEWSAGTQIAIGGFTVGGSYRGINAEHNAALQGYGLSRGHVWDAGVAYATGPYSVSFSTLQSVAEGVTAHTDQTLSNYQLSGKYAMAPGVDVLASVAYVKAKDESDATEAGENKGWTAMTGLSLTF